MHITRRAYRLVAARIAQTAATYDVSPTRRYGELWTAAECRQMDARRDAALADDRRLLARLRLRLGW